MWLRSILLLPTFSACLSRRERGHLGIISFLALRGFRLTAVLGGGGSVLQLVRVKGSSYRYHVVGSDGLPDEPLTTFIEEQRHSLAEGSAALYARELLAFLNWCESDAISVRNGWNAFGPIAEVRQLVRQYLSVAASCKITVRPDQLGLKVAYVNESAGTHINTRVFLCALRRFYDFLTERSGYTDANPLAVTGYSAAVRELHRSRQAVIREMIGRNPMSAESGVDPPTDIRLSSNFFRCAGREWLPESIDDPLFPRVIYTAGRKYGWGLREFCITRTLFESGARISEVIGLTAADWAVSRFLNQFSARNKGSLGIRTKRLVISHGLASLYRRYFDDPQSGRLGCDPHHLSMNDLQKILSDNPDRLCKVPLFITERGTPMTSNLFRDHYWRPALRAAGIHAHPHQARHWFVTNALRTVEATAAGEQDQRRRKEELIRYMKWRSGEKMLRAYEHVDRETQFITKTLPVIHAEMKRLEREAADDQRHDAVTPAPERAPDPDLALLTGVIG
jgi:integrase